MAQARGHDRGGDFRPVIEELTGTDGKILKTSLTHEDEAKLQAAWCGQKK